MTFQDGRHTHNNRKTLYHFFFLQNSYLGHTEYSLAVTIFLFDYFPLFCRIFLIYYTETSILHIGNMTIFMESVLVPDCPKIT